MWKFTKTDRSNASPTPVEPGLVQPVGVTSSSSAGSMGANPTVREAPDPLSRPSMMPPRDNDKHIYFKDLKMLAAEDDDADGDVSEGPGSPEHGQTQGFGPAGGAGAAAAPGTGSGGGGSRPGSGLAAPGAGAGGPAAGVAGGATRARSRTGRGRVKGRRVDRQKLIVIFVGLPARGKTFLCNKLMCYLNWLGHPTRHFNVGAYRRQQCEGQDFQDASFFDPDNKDGQVARARALEAALDDMEAWLSKEGSQVAMVDATNSTSARRQLLVKRLQGRFEYVFVESVCNDEEVLARNYRLKMLYSPDYRDMSREDAMEDFLARIRKYEAAYETIADRTLHFIRLIDMVTGRGHMDINRISGYLPGKMVMYLMQVCHSASRPRRIWLTRHGESEYNTMGKIGGNSGLSRRGAAYARLLPGILMDRVPHSAASAGSTAAVKEPVAVWTSTLARTIMTASGLPWPQVQWKALDEIQSGICDGMTYAEIAARLPGEFELRRRDKLAYRYPSGESYQDVIQRLEPVATEVERVKQCVVIVSHQAVLRALYGYFMNRTLEEVPSIDIPLHTIMELTPQPDGTMAETRFRVDIDRALRDADIQATFSASGAVGPAPFTPQADHLDEWDDPAELKIGMPARTPSLAQLRAADLVEQVAACGILDSDEEQV